MVVDEALLDQLIVDQRRAIRYYALFVFGLVGLGLAVVLATSLSPLWLKQPDIPKAILEIGGGFISTLSALPLKEILTRKERVGIFETVKIRVQALRGSQNPADALERERTQELLRQIVEKIALAG